MKRPKWVERAKHDGHIHRKRICDIRSICADRFQEVFFGVMTGDAHTNLFIRLSDFCPVLNDWLLLQQFYCLRMWESRKSRNLRP